MVRMSNNQFAYLWLLGTSFITGASASRIRSRQLLLLIALTMQIQSGKCCALGEFRGVGNTQFPRTRFQNHMISIVIS